MNRNKLIEEAHELRKCCEELHAHTGRITGGESEDIARRTLTHLEETGSLRRRLGRLYESLIGESHSVVKETLRECDRLLLSTQQDYQKVREELGAEKSRTGKELQCLQGAKKVVSTYGKGASGKEK